VKQVSTTGYRFCDAILQPRIAGDLATPVRAARSGFGFSCGSTEEAGRNTPQYDAIPVIPVTKNDTRAILLAFSWDGTIAKMETLFLPANYHMFVMSVPAEMFLG
jgi:hypothetical protein